jgi:competence protein ComEC
MALQNPLVINHDLGFQLSFLAVLGLLYLTPIVDNWVKSLMGDKIAWVRNIISATLAAQIAVAPFLLVATHGLSFSGLIANILIVPVMPICLGLGFIYPFFSIIPFAGKVIAILSFPLIAYLNGVIDFFASLPFSYLNIQIPGFYAFSIYLVIITFLVRYKKEGSICIGEIK